MGLTTTLVTVCAIVASLLLPGAGWAWAWRHPMRLFASGMYSVLALFIGIVGSAILGMPITIPRLALWLAAVTTAGFILLATRKEAAVGNPQAESRTPCWFAMAIAPMVGVAVWRATGQPLSGADADFRWDHLARLIVQFRTLDYYPPRSAQDFGLYFWPDGIAPLVSGVYAWVYLVARSTAKVWTAVPVLLQYGGLLAVLSGLGSRFGGRKAGLLACALGAGTMLLQFSFELGQETGFTGLGVAGMAFYLVAWEQEGRARHLIAAAACASVAGLAREYGVLFIIVGTAWIVLRKPGAAGGPIPRRHEGAADRAREADAGPATVMDESALFSFPRRLRLAVAFAAAAGLGPLLWYGRNWVLTGNPVYSLDLAGLFQVNPVFAAWMRGYRETYGAVFSQLDGWKEIGRLAALSIIPAAVGLLAGVVRWRHFPGWFGLLMTASAVLFAWVASVPYTAGGLFYSMRVLSPLLVIGCAWGGAALASWKQFDRNRAGILLGCWLFAGDASLRALTVPLNPYAVPPGEWLSAGYILQTRFDLVDRPFVQAVARSAKGKVLSESAGIQHVFLDEGKLLIPLWSPEVGFLFDARPRGDVVDHLIALGYSDLLLTRTRSSVDFLARMNALAHLEGRLKPRMANGTFIVFEFIPSSKANVVAHNRRD